MTPNPQLTSADGTPEEPLPDSPVLTARDDDAPRPLGHIKREPTTEQEN